MALEKTVIIGSMNIVKDSANYQHIHVKTVTVITEDGVEISRTNHRHVVHPNSDVSTESDDVKNLANSIYTEEIKTAYSAYAQSQLLD
tara:strand:+ start:465 stop:728 length:264 start_codon:yes stop_codon:yes gene_type:complete